MTPSTGQSLDGPQIDGPQIDGVIFDFGGVFVPSPFAAVAAAAEAIGADPADVLHLVFGPYDQDTDHPWHQVERGELTLGVYRDLVMATAAERGIEVDPWQILLSMGSSTVGDGSDGRSIVRTEMLDVVGAIRRSGRKTAILTNNLAEIRDHWRRLLPVDEMFDDVVDSSEVGMRKPNPQIYALAVQRLGLTPGTVVFLDDAESNVVAARAAGLTGIVVEEDFSVAISELRLMLQL